LIITLKIERTIKKIVLKKIFLTFKWVDKIATAGIFKNLVLKKENKNYCTKAHER